MLILASTAAIPRGGIRRAFDRALWAVQFERAEAALDSPRVSAVRLSRSGGGWQRAVAAAFPARDGADRLGVAASLYSVSQRVGGERGARGAALANLLGGRPVAAAEILSTLKPSPDLAAVEAAAALSGGDAQHWLAALEANRQALAVEPRRPEALFNQAMILESLGIEPLVRRQWLAYLAVDSQSAWAAVAQRHLGRHPATDKAAWNQATADLGRISTGDLIRLTRRFPQQARTAAEGPILSSWADSMEKGDAKAAARQLERARVIGQVILQDSGESLVSDAVAAIANARDTSRLVHAHSAYRDGRVSYMNGDPSSADAKLNEAARDFDAAHSPMAGVARFYHAGILFDQNRVAEALPLLNALLASEKEAGGRHKALIARILYQIALCKAVTGQWSDSLAAVQQSMTIYRQLKERGFAAEAEAVLSEDLDFLGQPILARRHGFAALSGACASGDVKRARTILAALSRVELRGKQWTWARSIIALESALSPYYADPQLDADMRLRSATVESRLGFRETAISELSAARGSTMAIGDPPSAARLQADIDGIEGAIRRARDPKAALHLLVAAISFQRQVERSLVLPELLLERGRTYAALGDLDSAQRDFDDGIVELERQRRATRDTELRPGIFDDAVELFDAAVSLQLGRGSVPAAALEYAERGRARTVLEQLEGETTPRPSVAEVQARLGPEAALLEFASLPDQLAIFVVNSRQVVVRIVPVRRAELSAEAASLADALAAERRPPETRRLLETLFRRLIAPVMRDLAGINTITVVADDTLQRVSFAALLDPDSGQYLAERFVITSAPSAGVFASAALKAERQAVGLPRDAIIFANPSIPPDYPDLPSLYAAEDEARKIAPLYPRSKILAGDEATSASFVSLAPRYDVVHLGGHGVVNHTEPARSALICAPDGSNGVLTAHRIAQMRFDSTRLVVLAACGTDAGRNAAVEGASSLATAFLAAGAPAVLGTLWNIDDSAAAPLMESFHVRLAKGVAPAEALRQAQILAMRDSSPKARDPGNWAAFALIGASRAATNAR